MQNNQPSITAKFCAFARAHHSIFNRDKMFDDYLAYDFLGKEEYEHIREEVITILNKHSWQIPEIITWNEFLDELISPIILTRIKYAEDKLVDFAKSKEKIQYVICGAGLDTFAFRNEIQNIDIYGLDHPNTHKYKLERIKKLEWNVPAGTRYVPIDFETESIREALLSAGFREELPTFCTILGVTYYLNLESISKTFNEIAKVSNKECRIVFDYPDKGLAVNEYNRMQIINEITDAVGEHMKEGMYREELVDQLHKYGYIHKRYLPRRIYRNK